MASHERRDLLVLFRATLFAKFGFLFDVQTRGGTGQHFCSPARPELTRNCPAQPVYAQLQLIF